MRRAGTTAAALLLLGATAAGGAWLGWSGVLVPLLGRAAAAASSSEAAPAAGRSPLYYQDPDGKPFYAAGPRKAANGRDYVPVYDDPAPAQGGVQPPGRASAGKGRVLYYRAPMGPETSPVPKKDGMGMDYVPVTEGEAAAGGQPGAQEISPPAPASPPASGAPGGKGRVLYYRNPMGLPDTSPAPKKDPMGMAYLPVYENEAADAGAGVVTIAPGRMQVLGVRTAPVESRPAALTRTVRATGVVQFDERKLAVVTSRVGGWVEKLDVAATGDPVRRGQVLAEVYSPDLVASEEEYLVAARLGGGSLAAASLQRLRALGVPEDEVVRLRRTGRVAQRVPVLAPADGVVTEKMVVQGTRVGPDQPLYKTASLSPVWLIAEVQEQDLGAVRPGEQARASFVAFPGRSFEGTVDFIYPSLSAETRTGRVRIIVSNPDQALRAGMFATVEIEAPAGASSGPVLAVPSSAVLDSGRQQVVLVEKGEGRFEPRQVRIGAQGDGETQVLAGLKPGERVVVGANFLIDAESNIRAALQAFTAADAQDQGNQHGSKAP